LRSNDLIHNFLISLQKKKDANMDEFVNTKDKLSGADIKAMCTEAGLKSVY
jgi:ATP-dependent 26S proteasome regulatory subunit